VAKFRVKLNYDLKYFNKNIEGICAQARAKVAFQVQIRNGPVKIKDPTINVVPSTPTSTKQERTAPHCNIRTQRPRMKKRRGELLKPAWSATPCVRLAPVPMRGSYIREVENFGKRKVNTCALPFIVNFG